MYISYILASQLAIVMYISMMPTVEVFESLSCSYSYICIFHIYQEQWSLITIWRMDQRDCCAVAICKLEDEVASGPQAVAAYIRCHRIVMKMFYRGY